MHVAEYHVTQDLPYRAHEMLLKDYIYLRKWKYSITTLIRMLVIQIGLALRVNLSRIIQY